jgi:hypothetical protein
MATAYKFRAWIFSIEDRGREKETGRKHCRGYQRSIRKKCQNINTQAIELIPPWRKVINYFCRDQGGTNVGCQLTTTTAFSAVLLNMRGSSELNLLHVTLLAPGILRWILFFFLKTSSPLLESIRNASVIVTSLCLMCRSFNLTQRPSGYNAWYFV